MISLGLAEHGDHSGLELVFGRTEVPGFVRRTFSAGTTIIEPGVGPARTLFVSDGWAACARILPNGTRTVIDFALRGDLVSSELSNLTQESVTALTTLNAYEFSAQAIAGARASQTFNHLVNVRLMFRYARVAERLAGVTRRDALERTGHLLLELACRIPKNAKSGADRFECPLTQADIGDALGLSTVHVNRVLRDMRLEGLLSFRNGLVEFLDRKRLSERSDFDPSYLDPGTS